MPATHPIGPMVRLRALRNAYGLTAGQLAERMFEQGVPVDRNSLYNIESGLKKPSDRLLDAYARALAVSPLDVCQAPPRQLAVSPLVVGSNTSVGIASESDGRISLRVCQLAEDGHPVLELTHAAEDRETAAAFMRSLSLHAQHIAVLLGHPDIPPANELTMHGQPAAISETLTI